MDALELLPVMLPAPSQVGGDAVPVRGDAGAAQVLRIEEGGAASLGPPGAGSARGAAVAMVLTCEEAGIPMVFTVPLDRGLRLNGLAPLGLRAMHPGDVLSFKGASLLLVRRFRPEPAPVPEPLAAKPCPVCGEELRAAPACACECGSRMHLEAPEEGPESRRSLNCYLSVRICKKCGKETGLEERLIPEPGSLGF
jgi:hypothetical protein